MAERLYYFPWEEVGVPYRIKPGAGPGRVRVYKKGEVKPENLKGEDGLETKPGAHAFKFGKRGAELVLEESPLLFKFEGAEAGRGLITKVLEPLDDLLKKKEINSSFALDFGNDSLTITISTEGGGGGGVGDEAGSGGSGAGTGAAKFYAIKPKFPIGMILESEETVIICLRFVIRFFYHFCDAVNLSIDWWKKLPKDRPHDWPSSALGYYWWLNVFSVFAVKDAFYDLVNDHAQFVADALQKLGFEFELNLNAALSGTALGSIDANYTAAGRCWVPLATLLSPIIQFLCAGSPKPPPEGAGLADLIEPRIEAKANDHFCVKVGGFPVGLEVESRGTLAEGTLCIPKGSPLRKKIEQIGHDLADAADTYKNSRLKKLPDQMQLPRMILDLLDAELRNMIRLIKAAKKLYEHGKKAYDRLEDGDVTEDEVDAARGEAGEVAGDVRETGDALAATYQTASPHVKKIMGYLQGNPPADEPKGVGPKAEAVLAMLRATKVHGIAIEPGSPLQSAEEGDRKRLWIHVDDEEKAKVERASFHPPEPPEAVLENVTFRAPLPVRPALVGWDDYSDPDRKRSYSGIVAGFDLVKEAESFNEKRPGGQVPSQLARLRWTRDAKFWVWVETGLVSHLTEAKVPLPHLGLDDTGALLVTFDEVEKGKVSEADVSSLKGAKLHKRSTIWKVTLMKDATTDELREIEEQVDRNQPDDDPYATPGLDNIVATAKGWAAAEGAAGGVPGLGAGGAGGGDAVAGRFKSLGSALPSHGPRRRPRK